MTSKVNQIEMDFPVLFRKNREMAMGDGWYQIVYDLASAIQIEAQKACIPMNSDQYPMVVQVKEKFGTLRFYMYGANEAMRALIDVAEEKTYTVCETCGEPGEMRPGTWYRVSCDVCEEKIKSGWRG